MVGVNGKTKSVHRLVATALLPNPLGLPQINHKDGNKANNRVDNLEWTTASDNLRHAYRTGLRKPNSMRGEANPNHILCRAQVDDILDELKRVPSYRGQLSAIARRLGVSTNAIWAIKQRRTWV
jgi:hypothetical protein